MEAEEKTMETAGVGNFGPRPEAAGQMRRFIRAVIVLAVIFCVPLFRLFQYSLSSDMYSYMILMPVVTWYLIHIQKPWAIPAAAPVRGPGSVLLAAALLFGVAALTVEKWGATMELDQKLDFPIAAFLLGVGGMAFIFLGPAQLKACRFPLLMLLFLLPIPLVVMDHLVVFLQYGSAYLAEKFFELFGTPVSRMDLLFVLPNAAIRVAPECSGIHSSYILLIVSLLAGHLFLRSPWRRGVLAVAVLPLALLRNGFRVFTIGELCVHYGMRMIDSPIHRKGGPVFFVLSLVPFFLLLVWLRRGDRPAPASHENKI